MIVFWPSYLFKSLKNNVPKISIEGLMMRKQKKWSGVTKWFWKAKEQNSSKYDFFNEVWERHCWSSSNGNKHPFYNPSQNKFTKHVGYCPF